MSGKFPCIQKRGSIIFTWLECLTNMNVFQHQTDVSMCVFFPHALAESWKSFMVCPVWQLSGCGLHKCVDTSVTSQPVWKHATNSMWCNWSIAHTNINNGLFSYMQVTSCICFAMQKDASQKFLKYYFDLNLQHIKKVVVVFSTFASHPIESNPE